ncbi:MAG TPA: riboflavin synthase [Steroidobacteraceae bacterium]|nr:riboflavin synthase [Steroidobacteraceae bacterium]
MFTGIIVAQGTVLARADRGGDLALAIGTPAPAVAPALAGRLGVGDSISVEGVCLTATRVEADRFEADVSGETLGKTTLGGLEVGSHVNLEPSLRAGDALGGHWVSGHVDAVGTVASLASDARSRRLVFELPAELMRFVAPKGSICVNGVSLTVNGVAGNRFDVNIIPHTLEVTTLGALQVGARVNVEIDLVARYLERLLSAGKAPQ